MKKWFNGTLEDLTSPFVFNLKLDPLERFHEARGYDVWPEIMHGYSDLQ